MKFFEFRRVLTAWHSPDAFSALLGEVEKEYGERAYTAPGSDFYRGAWPVARLAHLLTAERIRLCAAEPPDAELEIAGRVHPFEVTEADRPGRKRNLEVKSEQCLLAKLAAAQPLSNEEAALAKLLYVFGASSEVERSAVRKLRAGMSCSEPERLGPVSA